MQRLRVLQSRDCLPLGIYPRFWPVQKPPLPFLMAFHRSLINRLGTPMGLTVHKMWVPGRRVRNLPGPRLQLESSRLGEMPGSSAVAQAIYPGQVTSACLQTPTALSWICLKHLYNKNTWKRIPVCSADSKSRLSPLWSSWMGLFQPLSLLKQLENKTDLIFKCFSLGLNSGPDSCFPFLSFMSPSFRTW